MTAKIPRLACADYVALKQERHREIVMELNIIGSVVLSFTISLDQLRHAPPEVRHWVEHELAASLRGLAEPVGIYRSGPALEQFFLDCGLDMRVGSASRVPATTDCLETGHGQAGGRCRP
jgi:hypothetical protein